MMKERTLRVLEFTKIRDQLAGKALTELGAGVLLDPEKNVIRPGEADRFGLLDTGTGSMEKVRVAGGRLEHPVNEVRPDGGTNMAAYVIICGRTYEVFGDALGEVREAEPAPKAQKEVDLRRRTDLANQQVEQRCRQGRFLVTYDAEGYAVKARRV